MPIKPKTQEELAAIRRIPRKAVEFNKVFNVPDCTWLKHYGYRNLEEDKPTKKDDYFCLDEFEKCSVEFDALMRMTFCANDSEPESRFLLLLNGERAAVFSMENGTWRCEEAYNNYAWMIDKSIEDIRERVKTSKMNKEWVRL